MSHFVVGVFTEREGADFENLLAPYSENLRVEPYVDMTKSELILFGKENAKSGDPLMTDEEAYKSALEYFGSDSIDPDTGDLTTTYNPSSKWDWYEIGGRWSSMLLGKDGNLYDYLPADQIDFEAMRADRLASLQPYKEFIDGDHIYKKEYLLGKYPDEQTYIKKMTEFSTFAVVTPDGEWHEKGEMGWFGCSSETADEDNEWCDGYYDAFIKPAIENGWELTIVDCHI